MEETKIQPITTREEAWRRFNAAKNQKKELLASIEAQRNKEIERCTATLYNNGDMTIFKFGGQIIKFKTSKKLERYTEVKIWNHGFIEVMAQYKGIGLVEEYIDLNSILENLYIDPETFLSPIEKVEVKYE
ncbi:MAG: hypothetical protein LIP09_15245 [Bacteroidales bacterium]|nr:hypothetical protein [Bacteroidales bacterium]